MKWPLPHKMSVLIVDDHEDMRKSIRSILKQTKQGKYFFEASNGKDAWDFLERSREPFHLIISDLNMPRMNGEELLVKVRGSKKYRDTPFLMITSAAEKDTVASAAENEVDAYLKKPFSHEAIEEKIKDLMDKASNPSPWSKHLTKARKMEGLGKLQVAVKEVKEAVKLCPRASRPLRELGILYLKQKKVMDGLDCFKKATDMNSLDVSAFHYLGQTYYRLNMVNEAIESYSKAMDINPRRTERAVSFATVLLEEDRRDEAEEILKQAVKTCGKDLDLKEDIIDLCFKNGLQELAENTCKEVLEVDPDRSYLGSKEGIDLFKKGTKVEQTHILEDPEEVFSDAFAAEDIEVLLTLASSYIEGEKYAEAKENVLKIIKMDPKNKEALQILKLCKEKENK